MISSSTYAKYYFALRAIGEKVDFRRRYNALVLVQPENSKSIEVRLGVGLNVALHHASKRAASVLQPVTCSLFPVFVKPSRTFSVCVCVLQQTIQWRITASREGPTPMKLIGTPSVFSMYST